MKWFEKYHWVTLFPLLALLAGGFYCNETLLIDISVINEREAKMSYGSRAKEQAAALKPLAEPFVRLWPKEGNASAAGITFLAPGAICRVKSDKFGKDQYATRIIVLHGEVVLNEGIIDITEPTLFIWNFSSQVAMQYRDALNDFALGTVPVMMLTPASQRLPFKPWTVVSVKEDMSEEKAESHVKATGWEDFDANVPF